MNMTIASHKDLLVDTLNEWDTAQQTANKRRSDMHRIIAALPEEAGTPLAPAVPSQKSTQRPVLDKSGGAKDRPVLTMAPQPEIVEAKSTSKPATKRMSPLEKKARIQEALLYRQKNSHLTLEQVAVQHGLEPKALSRSYANKLKKAMPPERSKTPKDEAEDFLYKEKRRKEW